MRVIIVVTPSSLPLAHNTHMHLRPAQAVVFDGWCLPPRVRLTAVCNDGDRPLNFEAYLTVFFIMLMISLAYPHPHLTYPQPTQSPRFKPLTLILTLTLTLTLNLTLNLTLTRYLVHSQVSFCFSSPSAVSILCLESCESRFWL